MNIVLFGASGTIGSRILNEALTRGHRVTAVVQTPSKITLQDDNLAVRKADIHDARVVSDLALGHDLVISAYGPAPGATNDDMIVVAESLIRGLTSAGVHRLIIVGGAGSLYVAPGLQLVDAPNFPAEFKSIALQHREALPVYRAANLDWTYFSPAASIAPGQRTGIYRLGSTELLVDDNGESRISAEDFAIAVIDEAESGKHRREQITAAY